MQSLLLSLPTCLHPSLYITSHRHPIFSNPSGLSLSLSLSKTTIVHGGTPPPSPAPSPPTPPSPPSHRYDASDKTFFPRRGPSAGELLVVLALLPVGGSLLGLAGITLVGSLIGLAVVTPLFVIFSPVLVPAAIGVFLAVAGVLTSGALGVTGLSSLAWVANCLRQASASMPQQLDEAKRGLQDMAVHMGQKTKEAGQAIQNKAQEAAK